MEHVKMGPLLFVGVAGKYPVCNRSYALEIDLVDIEICMYSLELAQGSLETFLWSKRHS